MSIVPEPYLSPVPQPIYETLDDLNSVIKAAQQELPVMTPNQLRTWFGVFQNTLLNELTKLH